MQHKCKTIRLVIDDVGPRDRDPVPSRTPGIIGWYEDTG
jgi:hypothetical protein